MDPNLEAPSNKLECWMAYRRSWGDGGLFFKLAKELAVMDMLSLLNLNLVRRKKPFTIHSREITSLHEIASE
jgi:hypothetical protein